MDFTAATIQFLEFIAKYTHSYGWAIIVVTFLVRGLLWGVNVKQQKSMRMMQSMQPKLKALQDRYKNNPQVLQQKMMEFYKENKFNPFSGCLPLLIQLPVFILLYSALMSPQFIQIAGDSSFFFINRLDNIMRSTTGVASDGVFSIKEKDTFSVPKTIDVVMKDGSTVNVKVDNPQRALQVQGDIEPSQPLDLKIPLDNIKLKFEQLNNIQSSKVLVMNNSTKEVEPVDFARQDGNLIATVKTDKAITVIHYDVLFLVLLFGLSMWFATKITTAVSGNNTDATQQAMQQTMGSVMPLMITAMFVFFPIPAGVLLYLIVSNIIQIAQTVIVNKQLDAADGDKTLKVDNYDLSNAKQIEPKNVSDDNK